MIQFVSSYSSLLCFSKCYYDLDLEKPEASSSCYGDQLCQVVRFLSLRFILYPAYNVFLLRDNTTLTFDLRPWKTIGIFLASCWSNVPSCKILELTVRPTRRGQTHGRRSTLIRPVKEGPHAPTLLEYAAHNEWQVHALVLGIPTENHNIRWLVFGSYT